MVVTICVSARVRFTHNCKINEIRPAIRLPRRPSKSRRILRRIITTAVRIAFVFKRLVKSQNQVREIKVCGVVEGVCGAHHIRVQCRVVGGWIKGVSCKDGVMITRNHCRWTCRAVFWCTRRCVLFTRISLLPNVRFRICRLDSSNIPLDTKRIFSSQQPLLIPSVLFFFDHSGFIV